MQTLNLLSDLPNVLRRNYSVPLAHDMTRSVGHHEILNGSKLHKGFPFFLLGEQFFEVV